MAQYVLYTAPVMFEALTMRARFAIGSSSSDTAELPAEERGRGGEGGRGGGMEREGGRFAKVSYTSERKGRERAQRESEREESSKVSVTTAVAMTHSRSHSISSCDWDGSER
jgi:hypothetical protein